MTGRLAIALTRPNTDSGGSAERATPMVRDRPIRALIIALVLGSSLVIADAPQAPARSEPHTICFDCFWQYQDPAFRDELIRFYGGYETDDPVLRAELTYLLARVEGSPEKLCKSFDAFETIDASTLEPARALLVAETLAFTAEECGRDPLDFFRKAASFARSVGDDPKAAIYDAIIRKAFRPRFGDAVIVGKTAPPSGARAYVLGESAIHVAPNQVAGVQIERTVRDWISYQMAHDFSGVPARPEALLTYHEGARLREIVGAGKVTVHALSGTLAARSGSKWFAADENGGFRFEVLPDKLQYPTTRVWGRPRATRGHARHLVHRCTGPAPACRPGHRMWRPPEQDEGCLLPGPQRRERLLPV